MSSNVCLVENQREKSMEYCELQVIHPDSPQPLRSVIHQTYMKQQLQDQLVELRLCLKALPTDIPVPLAAESKYKFSDFTPDAEWAADIGEAGAVNRELEVKFGNRVDGLKLIERGPETEAVVDVLETWIEKCPGNIILEQWVNDILEAARGAILAAG